MANYNDSASATTKHLYQGQSSNILWTDRRDVYISPNVVKELWTDATPFLTMVSNIQQKSGLKDPMFKMFEHRNPWQKQQFIIKGTTSTGTSLSGNTAASVTLPAASATTIIGLPSPLDESLIGLELSIHAVDSSSKPTGDRLGVAIVTAVSMAADPGTISLKTLGGAFSLTADTEYCAIIIGNAKGEGTEARESWSDDLQLVWNQTQIFSTPLEITETLKKAVLRGESNELTRLRAQKAMEHKIQKEKAFLYGSSRLGTNMLGGDTFSDALTTDANGKTLRTTMGMIEILFKYGRTTGDDQNVFSLNEASYTYGQFVDDMEKVFQYYPEDGVKTMFCGHKMLSYWSKMEQAKGLAKNSGWTIRLSDMKRDRLGFNYRTLETPHGILQLVPTPALSRLYNGYGVVVDKSNVFHAIYRSSLYQSNIKTDNAYDAQKDQYFSDEGIGINLLESHKLFKLV